MTRFCAGVHVGATLPTAGYDVPFFGNCTVGTLDTQPATATASTATKEPATSRAARSTLIRSPDAQFSGERILPVNQPGRRRCRGRAAGGGRSGVLAAD